MRRNIASWLTCTEGVEGERKHQDGHHWRKAERARTADADDSAPVPQPMAIPAPVSPKEPPAGEAVGSEVRASQVIEIQCTRIEYYRSCSQTASPAKLPCSFAVVSESVSNTYMHD